MVTLDGTEQWIGLSSLVEKKIEKKNQLLTEYDIYNKTHHKYFC